MELGIRGGWIKNPFALLLILILNNDLQNFFFHAGDKDSSFKATIKYKWKYNDKDIELNDYIVWSDNAHSLIFLKAQVQKK